LLALTLSNQDSTMKKWLIIILLQASVIYSQQYDKIFDVNYPERIMLIDSIVRNDIKPLVEDSTGFYLKLDQLSSISRIKKDKKAIFYTEYLSFYFELSNNKIEEKQVLKKAEQLAGEASKLDLPQIEANLFNDVGYYYYNRPNPDYILYFDNLNKGYQFYKDLDVKEYPDKAYNLYSLALSYYQFGDYTDAITFAKKVPSLKDGDNFVDLFNFNLLGMAYLRLNKFDSSRIYLEETYKLANSFPKEKSLGWTGIAKGNIGHTWYKEGKFENAIPYYLEAISICDSTKIRGNVSPFSSRLISCYTKLGMMDEAKKFIPLARTTTYMYNQNEGYLLLYNSLADYYKATMEGNLAIVYRDSAILYTDSLQKTFDRNLKVQLELSNYQEQARAKEAVFNSNKARQNVIRNSIIGFTILLISVAIFVYIRQKQLLVNKTVLLKEIHHRVKNNLQLISSILDIQQRSLNDEKLMHAFTDAQSRISTMALVHQNLYEKENIGTTDSSEYFEQLFQNITLSYAPPNIKITHSIKSEGKLTIDTLIPVALIFNELLTNTYKYAFKGRETGYIQFELIQKNDLFLMSYSDNGVGFPAGFDFSKSRGLGSLMIRKFTQQLFGTFNVDSSEKGVKFIFSFKASK
jgi:two-component sensor histidine kinase